LLTYLKLSGHSIGFLLKRASSMESSA